MGAVLNPLCTHCGHTDVAIDFSEADIAPRPLTGRDREKPVIPISPERLSVAFNSRGEELHFHRKEQIDEIRP